MGTELVPKTLYSNELTQLCAREDYIEPKIVFEIVQYGEYLMEYKEK
jgi:hypothetical protein